MYVRLLVWFGRAGRYRNLYLMAAVSAVAMMAVSMITVPYTHLKVPTSPYGFGLAGLVGIANSISWRRSRRLR